jgi:hypothetical protein
MVTILKKGASTEAVKEIEKRLGNRPTKKGLNAKKYCGIVKFTQDGLAIQKQLRDEWC